MRDTRSGAGRGSRSGAARGRQGGYSREAAPRGQTRPAQASHDRAQAPYEQSQPRPKYRLRVTPASIGTLLLLAAVAVAVVIGIFANAERESFKPGVMAAGIKINGKDYSGWKVERITQSLKDEYQKKIENIQIKVTHQDQTWTFTGDDLDATENIDEVVSQAAMLAHVGTLEQKRAEAEEIKQQGGRDFPVQLTLDPEKLKAALLDKTAFLAEPGRNATVVFNPSLVEFEIPDQIEDFNPPQSEIDKMFLVNPELPGKEVDVDMMVQKIMDALKQSSNVELELLTKDFVPQVTEAKLRESFHLVTAYRTPLRGSTDDRNFNIQHALDNFNVIFMPGEIISFNEKTGERSEANGYRLAHTISGDKSIVDDFGGGVCQASTTLYNAALMAGCDILARGHHSFPSAYALEGFDAMVNYPSADLKFKNTSDENLYIKAYLKKPWVYVMIFGKPLKDGMKITRQHELVYQGPPPQVKTIKDTKGEYADFVLYTDDKPYVRVSGQPEMRYKAYLVYLGKDGTILKKEELYEDHFSEITREEVVGVQVRPGSDVPGGTEQP